MNIGHLNFKVFQDTWEVWEFLNLAAVTAYAALPQLLWSDFLICLCLTDLLFN